MEMALRHCTEGVLLKMAVILAVSLAVLSGVEHAYAQTEDEILPPSRFYLLNISHGTQCSGLAGELDIEGIYHIDGSISIEMNDAITTIDAISTMLALEVGFLVIETPITEIAIFNYTLVGSDISFIIPRDVVDLIIDGDISSTSFKIYAMFTQTPITYDGTANNVKAILRDDIDYDDYKKFSSFTGLTMLTPKDKATLLVHPTDGNVTLRTMDNLIPPTACFMTDDAVDLQTEALPEFFVVEEVNTLCDNQGDEVRAVASGIYNFDGSLDLMVTGYHGLPADDYITNYVISGPNGNLAFYNYTLVVDENKDDNEKRMVTFDLSPETVMLFSDDPFNDEILITPHQQSVGAEFADSAFVTMIKAIDQEGISLEHYNTFSSFVDNTFLIDGGTPYAVRPGVGNVTEKLSTPLPALSDIAGNSCRVGQVAPEIGLQKVAKVGKSSNNGGDDDDWHLNPTFGRTWADNVQLVRQGFSFNDRTFDVTDNYHVDYTRTTSVIGDENTVKLKVYAQERLDSVMFSLGVPEISRATDAESDIMVKLQANYENPAEYDIVGIIHDQEENLVDPEATTVSVELVKCNPIQEIKCHEFTINFRIMAPLLSDVLAISAMDIDRRATTTYINDGVEFAGESLLPAKTSIVYFKKGNQYPAEIIRLEQQDRRYNLWSDPDGYVWMKNSYGSLFQLTHAGFERLQDQDMKVMTRTHSNFADLIEYEREKARLVFDAESIKSTVGESFSFDAPVKIEKLQDPVILEKLRVAELAALEYLKSHR
ncbi:MAG: hypothetical protein EB828_04585 [Nitrosopumilus sp. D6]|nr:MAG: hypothetical protein EB828_04585 [Nitrosopumilus sp. D6]